MVEPLSPFYLPEPQGERLSIEIEFGPWIPDHDCRALERAIESFFSLWLLARMDRDLHDSDVARLRAAREAVLSMPRPPDEYLLARYGRIDFRIEALPAFLLVEVERGSLRKKLQIAVLAALTFTGQQMASGIIQNGAWEGVRSYLVDTDHTSADFLAHLDRDCRNADITELSEDQLVQLANLCRTLSISPHAKITLKVEKPGAPHQGRVAFSFDAKEADFRLRQVLAEFARRRQKQLGTA